MDDLRFRVRWSDRRHTIGITVKRSGELLIAAPRHASAARLEAVARDKLPWVRRKLAELEALGPPPEPREIVAGECFPILGRKYRLQLADRPPQAVSLTGDALVVDRSLDGTARAAVVTWYEERARDYISTAVARFVPLVGAAPDAVVVRDLGRRRWGTCDQRTRTVSFHWPLIAQAPDLVDYVVVHELAHLRELNHGPGFWRHVEDVLPDWRERRRRLRVHSDLFIL